MKKDVALILYIVGMSNQCFSRERWRELGEKVREKQPESE